MMMRLEFKPADCWIGAFWRTKVVGAYIGRFDIWICLLPMLPLHLWTYFDRKEKP